MQPQFSTSGCWKKWVQNVSCYWELWLKISWDSREFFRNFLSDIFSSVCRLRHKRLILPEKKAASVDCSNVHTEGDFAKLLPVWTQHTNITYKINAKTQYGVTQMLWYTRCKSRDVSSITYITLSQAENTFQANLRDIFSARHCCDSSTVTDVPTSWQHKCPDVCILNQTWGSKQLELWKQCFRNMELYQTTLYTSWLHYKHRHSLAKFSNVSGTSKTDTVQQRWLSCT